MSAPPCLSAKGVSRRFDSGMALDHVSFAVHAGEVHCLLGDNGAGKSTLIQILSGALEPTGGDLFMDGEPLQLASPREARDHGIATVYQDLALVPLMSVARNFVLGREPVRRFGPFAVFDAAAAGRLAREALDRMSIEVSDVDRAVSTLSGGQRQCVAIARALHHGARVLILDEPTSALGVAQSAGVLRNVRTARDQGVGVVLITHNVEHALAVGDRFTVLERGRSVLSVVASEATREGLQRAMAGGRSLDAETQRGRPPA
ncbi:MAG: ATP-binding cassette domain-containing protein [Myxococcota bacterium]|nr:ATP-binding cassette domain-containing protein [Myxococcota bacterium]